MSTTHHRSWLLLLGCTVVLVATALVILWWTLPIIAPELVLRTCPAGDMSERAVIRLVEQACDQKKPFAAPMNDSYQVHPSFGAGFARGLKHPRSDVRIAIIDACQPGMYIRPLAGVLSPEALTMALGDPEPAVRSGALMILSARNSTAIDNVHLRTVATDPDRGVRTEAARYVRQRKIGDIAVIMLNDKDPVIREMAIGGLDLRSDPRRAEKMLPLLKDSEQAVRVAVGKALGELGDERALPVLIASLSTPDAVVREALVNALGKIEDIRALPAVTKALTDQAMLVRRAAANALGVIGDPRAIPALAKCSREDPDRSVRCAAVSSLEAIKDPATLDPLMQAMKDPDPLVRAMAEAAIGRRP